MKKTKLISKILLVLLMSMSLNLSQVSFTGAARLTSAKDTMTRTQASGVGAATAGYTQSTAAVTDGFLFVAATNEDIYWDPNGSGLPGDTTADLITNGGLIAGVVYTGDQVATAIKTALEATDGDVDDVYAVTYDEGTDLFTIRGDGANTQNANIDWDNVLSTAAATLGYTADDTSIRDANKVSDNAVAFNVVTGSNNTFNVRVDAEGPNAVTIVAGPYTAATLVTEIDTRIDAASTSNVTVSYASSKFKITSDATGAGSSIVVTEGGNDFLKTVKLVNDVPVNGKQASGLVVANHTIQFITTTAVANGEKVVVTFPGGFDLTNITEDDVDIAGSTEGELTTAVDCAQVGAEKASVVKAGQVITITLCAGDGGDFLASETVTIEVGRNATSSGTGSNQIANPTTVGLYQTHVETKSAADVVIDDSYIGVYIISDDSVIITATVDPVLAMTLNGGTVLDFGTLENNAFHKLGGARNAYGYVDLTAFVADGADEGTTISIRGIIYELSDDGAIAPTSHAKVDIVDNENNYLTKEQVASNLYRAINNYDGTLIRANVGAADTDRVYLLATSSGVAGNAYTLATTVTGATVSGADFTDGYDGYNKNSNTLVYASGVDVGNGSTGTNLVVSTNAVSGYVLTIQNSAADLNNGTNTIIDWAGQYGWGIYATSQSARYGDATADVIAAAYRSTAVTPGTMSSTVATLASYAGTAAGDNIVVEYNIRIPPDQASGLYTDTVTYILTSTF